MKVINLQTKNNIDARKEKITMYFVKINHKRLQFRTYKVVVELNTKVKLETAIDYNLF